MQSVRNQSVNSALVRKPLVRSTTYDQSLDSGYCVPESVAQRGRLGDLGNSMAKGHLCPNCGKNTLQPYTTNQLKCTNCETVVKRDQLT